MPKCILRSDNRWVELDVQFPKTIILNVSRVLPLQARPQWKVCCLFFSNMFLEIKYIVIYFKFVLFSINERISYTHTLSFCFRTTILWRAFQVSPQRLATLCRCMGTLSFMEAHTEGENTVSRQLFSRVSRVKTLLYRFLCRKQKYYETVMKLLS